MLTEREKALAIREGAQNAASHEYFSARSIGFDTSHNRAVFESGFVRGYDAACAERDARIAELERQLAQAREMLKDIYKLLRRTPPTTRNMFVGADAVPWGKQASDIAKLVKEAIDAKAKP